jgi:non-ribosomal peptide synthase protein (TIGR01720 family)
MGNKLNITIEYNSLQFNEDRVRQLAEMYIGNLEKIIRHCSQKEERELTPGDLVMDGSLSLDEFDDLQDFMDQNIEL